MSAGFLRARRLVVISPAHGIVAVWVVEPVSSPCGTLPSLRWWVGCRYLGSGQIPPGSPVV